MILTCINPQCQRQFLKLHPNQKTCSPSCSAWLDKERRKRWRKTTAGKAAARRKRRKRKTPTLDAF